VHEPRLVEMTARLPHTFDAPIERVVIGAGEEVEAELLQVSSDLGLGHERPITGGSVRKARETAPIDRGVLEVSKRGVGCPHGVHDGGELGLEGKKRCQRMGDDAVSDGGQCEGIVRGHRELAIGRSLRVEAFLGVLCPGGGTEDGEYSQREPASRPSHSRHPPQTCESYLLECCYQSDGRENGLTSVRWPYSSMKIESRVFDFQGMLER
jgi:hypothetical protein